MTDPSRPFEELYRKLRPGLVRLASLLMDSKEGAEDMVQEAFVQLCPKWGNVAQPEAYLRRTVTNLACDAYRRSERQKRLPRFSGAEVPKTEDVELWDAVNRLPARERAAMILRYHEDLSVAEVAHAMRCPLGTASSLLSRAKAMLRRELGK